MAELKIGKHKVNITHPGKIYFPKSNITKGELIDYYYKIADVIILHIKNRPISMVRSPNGLKGESFFQKEAADYYPEWIKTKKIKKEGGSVNHVIINNRGTLVYLANQACITPHIWLSKIDKINYPDRLIFDLDPSKKDDLKNLISSAKILRIFFEKELQLNPFIMTTGSRGFHIVIPLIRNEDFDSVRKFAQNCAKILVNRHSKILTDEVRKNKRKGRIFLDTARNAYAQTAVPPYSVRLKEGAPISAPIDWKELSSDMTPQKFNIKNIFKRLDKKGELWQHINTEKKSLRKSRKILGKIIEAELRH